jgi:hypothetical protein
VRFTLTLSPKWGCDINNDELLQTTWEHKRKENEWKGDGDVVDDMNKP